jgi:hypothetical protein
MLSIRSYVPFARSLEIVPATPQCAAEPAVVDPSFLGPVDILGQCDAVTRFGHHDHMSDPPPPRLDMRETNKTTLDRWH